MKEMSVQEMERVDGGVWGTYCHWNSYRAIYFFY